MELEYFLLERIFLLSTQASMIGIKKLCEFCKVLLAGCFLNSLVKVMEEHSDSEPNVTSLESHCCSFFLVDLYLIFLIDLLIFKIKFWYCQNNPQSLSINLLITVSFGELSVIGLITQNCISLHNQQVSTNFLDSILWFCDKLIKFNINFCLDFIIF